MKKILVVDGNSIINRAFYGIRPLTTKSGKHTNAIYGMINIIMRQIDELKPDYAAVAFDLKAPTFRHEMFPEYKAGRSPTPEELKSQFPDAKECLDLLGLNVLELPGYEADDIQGTVAKMSHGCDDAHAYVLSGDRDLLQLIDPRVTVLLATNSDTLTMDEGAFFAKYGIPVSSFVDMKALMGDSSDNIPGVPGIGEKTAQALISEFGSLDGIYENIDSPKIKKGAREKLIAGKELAYLSKKLATIDTAAPIGKELSELEYRGLDKAGLYRKFTELELNSFITKFSLTKGEEIPCSEESVAAENEKFRDTGAAHLLAFGMKSFAIFEKCGEFYIYSEDHGSHRCRAELSEISALFVGSRIICYEAKPLIRRLLDLGADIGESTFLDLSVYAYVLSPGSGNATLPSLISMFLGENVGEGEPCPALMARLEAKMRSRIAEDGEERILDELETPLIPILAEIERRGFMIDRSGMTEFRDALLELENDLAESIYRQAGKSFNLNSPKQLGEVLFVDLGLPSGKKKGKNGFSTDAETLESLRSYSPIIDDILEYRHVSKLRNTYAAVLPELADKDDRIHTDFKQTMTATGRLSSADPNLQNIPIRTKMGREMRRYFKAKDGYTLVDADYSQIELRLLAHISGDYNMQNAFIEGKDIHRKTAAAVFGIPEEYVNDEMRKRAKAVNFGIVYGISGFSLAKDIGTTTSEATKYIKSYLMNYPGIDEYLTRVVTEATELGYTVTPMGRRRYIPELTASNGALRAFGKRVAMNAPIQGAAADIMKLAMINVYRALKKSGIDAHIVMQVHDELVVEVRDSDADVCKRILKEEMEGAVELSIPLTVDVTEGTNWLEQEL